jgi:hypothetical protein
MGVAGPKDICMPQAPAKDLVVVQLDVVEHSAGVYYLTCQSPFGETNFRLEIPGTGDDLAGRLQTVETNVLRSGAQLITRGSAGRLEAPIRQLGTDLCDAILHDESRELFEISLRHAESIHAPFQLMLRIRGSTLAQLPWEFLYDRRRGDYLALNLPVVRYLDVMQPLAPVTVQLPLRILGVISHPDDRDQLEVAAEREALSAAVAPLGADQVQLHWLAGSGWEHLWRAARSEPWHILHFIGHGGFDDARGEGFLEFVDEHGGARHVYATDLGRLLHDNTSLRLAVLNACESGRAAGADTFASPAASIIRRGFPAAVAMQYEISDPAALVFAQAFYGAIAAGQPLDRAVTDARATVHMTQPGSLEWGTPVLYLRAKNANVFEVEVENAAEPAPDGPAPAEPAKAPPAEPAGDAARPAVTDTTLSKSGVEGLRRATDLMRSLASGSVRMPQAVGKASVRSPVTRSAEADPAPAPVTPPPAAPPPDPTGAGVTETHRFTHPGPVNAVVFDPVRRRVFAAGEYGEILCWDLDRARVCRCCRVADRPAAVRSLAVTRDGRYVAAVHDDRVVRIWDVDTEVVALTIRPPAGHAGRSVRISGDEGLLVIGCTGAVAVVADRHGIERMRLVHRQEADDGGGPRPPGDVYAAAFSPDSRWIATGAADGLVRIFGPDGRLVERLPHPGPVLDVAFRPDGRALGTAAADGNARLWDPHGRLRGRMSHDAEVRAVAFTADSRRLVTAGGDGTARVWGDDERATAWTSAGGPVAAVAVHPSGPFAMATAHADHTVRRWTLDDQVAGTAGAA